MDKYLCHKEVKAAKIVGIGKSDDGTFVLNFGNCNFIHVEAAWVMKHEPVAGGYYVEYEYGYTSFSPQKAFEDGYTKMENENHKELGKARSAHQKSLRSDYRKKYFRKNGLLNIIVLRAAQVRCVL